MFKLYKYFYAIVFLILSFNFYSYINGANNGENKLEDKRENILENILGDIDKKIEKFERLEEAEQIEQINNAFMFNFYKDIALDAWSYKSQLNKIELIANKDSLAIRKATVSGCLSNLFFILISPIYILNNINEYKRIRREKAHLIMAVSNTLDLISLATEYKFLSKNKEILNNSKKIAKYNNLSKKDGFKDKLVQHSWLAANKVLPYIGLLYSKYINNKSLNESLVAKHFSLWTVFRWFSNFSEIARKHYLYKNIMGDYKKYKELQEKKLQKLSFLQNQIEQISKIN